MRFYAALSRIGFCELIERKAGEGRILGSWNIGASKSLSTIVGSKYFLLRADSYVLLSVKLPKLGL